MDFKAAADLIIKELQTTTEIIDDFKNYPGVPPIQVELAKSKCNNIARLMEMLVELKKTETLVPDPAKQAPVKVILKEEVLPKEEVKPKEVPKHVSEETIRMQPHEQVTDSKVTGKTILGDSFGSQTGRLNEQLGSRRKDNGFTGRMRTKPVSNLSDVIGTNDKFLFIREIFQGNTETYNKAIGDLNNSADFNDAHSKLMNYTGGSDDGDAVGELLSLLKRKFSTDE